VLVHDDTAAECIVMLRDALEGLFEARGIETGPRIQKHGLVEMCRLREIEIEEPTLNGSERRVPGRALAVERFQRRGMMVRSSFSGVWTTR
jgi:hypothetical protein